MAHIPSRNDWYDRLKRQGSFFVDVNSGRSLGKGTGAKVKRRGSVKLRSQIKYKS